MILKLLYLLLLIKENSYALKGKKGLLYNLFLSCVKLMVFLHPPPHPSNEIGE